MKKRIYNYMKCVLFTLIFTLLPTIIGNAQGTSSIPKLYLELNGITISQINGGSKEVRYPENMLYVETDNMENVIEHMEIKGRGNSTWGFEKKPYQIKFLKKVDLLGLGKSKTWILLANYTDVCNLRNDICLNMAWQMGVCFENKGTWVRLYEGHDTPRYLGLYYLCHKNKIGDQELKLNDEKGILVEIDRQSDMKANDIYAPLKNTGEEISSHSVISLSDSVSEEEEVYKESFDSFVEAFNRLEQCALKGDWEGVCSIADVDSLARYYLFEEYIKNVDAWRKSVYFYRDGESDLIHAGPAWDFDNSLGSDEYALNGIFQTMNACSEEGFTIYYQEAPLYKALCNMPEFRALVADCFNHGFENVVESIINRAYFQRQNTQEAVEEDIRLYQKEGGRYLRQSSQIDANKQFRNMIYFMEERFKFLKEFYTEPMDLQAGTYQSSQGNVSIRKTKNGMYNIYEISKSRYLTVNQCKDFYISKYNGKMIVFSKDTGLPVDRLWIYNRISGLYYEEQPYNSNDNSYIPSVEAPVYYVKGTQILHIKKKGKSLKISWKKQKQGSSGYELQYSTRKKFSSKVKKIIISKPSISSKKIYRSGKKKLYFRIRVYKKIGKKTYYSTWSKVKIIR